MRTPVRMPYVSLAANIDNSSHLGNPPARIVTGRGPCFYPPILLPT